MKRTALGARADDQDVLTVGSRQPPRGEQAVASGFPFGDEVEIHDRGERAGFVIKEGHAAVDHRHLAVGIAGEDRGGFHRDAQPVDPRRAAEKRVFAAIEEGITNLGLGQVMPRGQRIGERNPVQQRFAFVERDIGDHGHAASSRLSSPA